MLRTQVTRNMDGHGMFKPAIIRKSKAQVKLVDRYPDGPLGQKRVFDDLTSRANHQEVGNESKRIRTTKSITECPTSTCPTSLKSTSNSKLPLPVKQTKWQKAVSVVKVPDVVLPKTLTNKPTECTLDLKQLSLAIQNVSSSLPDGVTNIDDQSDFFRSPLYANDIVQYIQRWEEVFRLPDNAFSKNKEVNSNMRSVLIDWMIQVQVHLVLQQSTLHLAVAIIDRFLAKQLISLNRLQLVGITSILLASKFNERFSPSIESLVHLTDNTYNYNQVIRMEQIILKVLQFQIHLPVATDFLDRFLRINSCVDDRMHQACMYTLDLALVDMKCSIYPPSIRAAAATSLMRRLMEEQALEDPDITFTSSSDEWSKSLQYFTSYSEHELLPAMCRFSKLLLRTAKSKFQGTRSKYSGKSFGRISYWEALTESELLHKLAQ